VASLGLAIKASEKLRVEIGDHTVREVPRVERSRRE